MSWIEGSRIVSANINNSNSIKAYPVEIRRLSAIDNNEFTYSTKIRLRQQKIGSINMYENTLSTNSIIVLTNFRPFSFVFILPPFDNSIDWVDTVLSILSSRLSNLKVNSKSYFSCSTKPINLYSAGCSMRMIQIHSPLQ